MDKATKAVFWCVALIVLGEVCLRAIEASPLPDSERVPRFETDRPYILVLGSSRVRRGMWPRQIERTWIRETGTRPWAASIWEKAVSYVGLSRIYLDEIRPWAGSSSIPNKLLAIEINGTSLNDSYMRDDEARYAEINTFATDLRAGKTDEASRQLMLASVRFTEVKGIVSERFGIGERQEVTESDGTENKIEEQIEREDDGGLTLPRYLRRYAWGQDFKGFERRAGAFSAEKLSDVREQYRTSLLKDYALGGIQHDYLRKLVQNAREDGFSIVLFIMPIAEEHREFWRAGQYEEYIAAAEALAAEFDAPLFHFDRDFPMRADEFQDTNHLNEIGAERLSAEFAKRAIAHWR